MATYPPAEDAPPTDQEDAAADLGALREILLGADQRRLEELSHRVRKRELRADDIADVLPEAFVREFERAPGRLTEALSKPLQESLHRSVRDDPRPLADAIFPVLGPAIRHYISASLRTLANSLSQMIERGLSPRRQLAWRFAAWRKGVPFGDYVLQRTFVYRVEHVYLIQAESGLLLGEAHHDETLVMDGDAVSGMLTAVQSFVIDSFSVDEGSRLDTAEIGDFTLWAVHGPHAMLACAIRGVPNNDLRTRFDEVLESIHLRFARVLQGEPASLPPPLQEMLDDCLVLRRAEDEAEARIGWPVWVMLVAVLAVLGRLLFVEVLHRRDVHNLTERLTDTPGVVVTDVERAGASLVVHGLRDPLAPPVRTLAAQAGVAREVIDRTQPYQSLETDLVLARLRKSLAPPSSVQLRLDAGVLLVSGIADEDWVEDARTRALFSPAVDRVDTSLLRSSDETLLASLRRALDPPPTISLALDERRLVVAGEASVAWLAMVRPRVQSLEGLRGVDFEGASATEVAQARELVARIGDADVFFERGSDAFREDSQLTLMQLVDDLQALDGLAKTLRRELTIKTIGHTDAVGNATANRALREERAEQLRRYLVEAGVPAAAISVDVADDAEAIDASLRKGSVRADMDLSPYPLASGDW